MPERRLLDHVSGVARLRQLSLRTEETGPELEAILITVMVLEADGGGEVCEPALPFVLRRLSKPSQASLAPATPANKACICCPAFHAPVRPAASMPSLQACCAPARSSIVVRTVPSI